MKSILLTISLFLIAYISKAQENTATVFVTIENVLHDKGNVLISLHNIETFMKGPGIIDLKEKAEKGPLTVTFNDIKPGNYAVLIMHDENSNSRMDFEANGMPKENYGSSGNTIHLGPPSFEASKFKVLNEDLYLTLKF